MLLRTRYGVGLLGRNWAVQFGLLSGAAQLYLAFWPDSSLPRLPALLVLAGASLTGAVVRSVPRNRITREFRHPSFTVTVEVGDLFDYAGHLVIGFSDTFDTDTTDDLLVARRSVQGQLLHRVLGGDLARLDTELSTALAGVPPVGTETRAAKPVGKLARYPVGTVAVIGTPRRRFFCAAYGRMGNDLIVGSSPEELWHSLSRLWDSAHLHARLEHLAMPVCGSDLARINSMDHSSLLKMILLSYVARSRDRVVCQSLTVVVHQSDYSRIDMLELDVFLRSL